MSLALSSLHVFSRPVHADRHAVFRAPSVGPMQQASPASCKPNRWMAVKRRVGPVFFRCLLRAVLLCLAGLCTGPVRADTLQQQLDGMRSFHARFSQQVADARGEIVQEGNGEVWIQKPGRFRWQYESPWQQLIVADGEHLWNYDADLEQATVSPLDETLGATPAVLLSGLRPLAEVMRSEALGRDEQGIDWYRLRPVGPDESVQEVRIGFEGTRLRSIRVRDSFDNDTRIRFSQVQSNPEIDPARFRIELPPGTDLVGEAR
ncbi:MAG TPA: outer membrane lipoprotein chaperone LolA [Gammaproteobacteria bacterium]|nr:outer membrane lipoprotein chaperone LolA [Gammaproteobacteria bacterium]